MQTGELSQSAEVPESAGNISLPPLPVPPTAAQLSALKFKVQNAKFKVRGSFRSPRDAAALGNQPMALAVIAPPIPLATNYFSFEFPSLRREVLFWGPLGSTATNTYTFTNITALIEVRTNFGAWHLLRSAPWPADGGQMGATNVGPYRALIQCRSGFTINP
jgi:hypothetical protein